MGWLLSVGSIRSYVSFAKYRLFHRALLQKRPIIFSSLLTVATPYIIVLRLIFLSHARARTRMRTRCSFLRSHDLSVIHMYIHTYISCMCIHVRAKNTYSIYCCIHTFLLSNVHTSYVHTYIHTKTDINDVLCIVFTCSST